MGKEKIVIGCKWAGALQKVEPDEYCYNCPFYPHTVECIHYRKAHQAVFVFNPHGKENDKSNKK